ncbi:hypothetical protein CDD80_574 [Ophiocordyceps camponoti-rufipedis]|uniref:Uncharacterized protein n=1 Tax=Ophiocordyceps camponoti-rufipedis TaxID=2004952 RepID=A0A2C5Z6I1_9HYPO|nr:hypothetical protein CDD80_574 [Ophiocordyceps camponoti-rufipedis]
MKFLAVTAVAVCFYGEVLAAPKACHGARKRNLDWTAGGVTKRSTADAKWTMELKSLMGLNSHKRESTKKRSILGVNWNSSVLGLTDQDGHKDSADKAKQQTSTEQNSPTANDGVKGAEKKEGQAQTSETSGKKDKAEKKEKKENKSNKEEKSKKEEKDKKEENPDNTEQQDNTDNPDKAKQEEQHNPRIVIGRENSKTQLSRQGRARNWTTTSMLAKHFNTKTETQAAARTSAFSHAQETGQATRAQETRQAETKADKNKANTQAKENEEDTISAQMAKLFGDNSSGDGKVNALGKDQSEFAEESNPSGNEFYESADEKDGAEDDNKTNAAVSGTARPNHHGASSAALNHGAAAAQQDQDSDGAGQELTGAANAVLGKKADLLAEMGLGAAKQGEDADEADEQAASAGQLGEGNVLNRVGDSGEKKKKKSNIFT